MVRLAICITSASEPLASISTRHAVRCHQVPLVCLTVRACPHLTNFCTQFQSIKHVKTISHSPFDDLHRLCFMLAPWPLSICLFHPDIATVIAGCHLVPPACLTVCIILPFTIEPTDHLAVWCYCYCFVLSLHAKVAVTTPGRFMYIRQYAPLWTAQSRPIVCLAACVASASHKFLGLYHASCTRCLCLPQGSSNKYLNQAWQSVCSSNTMGVPPVAMMSAFHVPLQASSAAVQPSMYAVYTARGIRSRA